MAKVIIFAMLLLAIGAITGSAAAADERLFTVCTPMDFVVEELDPEDSRETGPDKESYCQRGGISITGSTIVCPP